MLNITTITPVDSFYLLEEPGSPKFNAELTIKINTLITNHVTENTYLEKLLKGSTGGTEQAKIPFGLSAAPTGWTRDATVATDNVLRVTTGVGGGSSGTWSLSGISTDTVANHTHDTGAHMHDLGSHSHTLTQHNHTMAHTHGGYPGGHSHNMSTQAAMSLTTGTVDVLVPLSGSGGVPIANADHTHSACNQHQHSIGGTVWQTGDTSSANVGDSAVGLTTDSLSTNASGGPTSDVTTSGGSHSHTISQDGTWRPKYLNILICKKD